jgi:fumarate reductase subunit D
VEDFDEVFLAAFFFECFFTPVVAVALSLAAGAGVVVAGAVCANEIAASASVIEKAVMVFIVIVRVLKDFV